MPSDPENRVTTMNADLLLHTSFLTVMGTISVALWTIRVALTGRGRRLAASATAGIEAVVFVLVFVSVLSSLNSPVEVGGYAVGPANARPRPLSRTNHRRPLIV